MITKTDSHILYWPRVNDVVQLYDGQAVSTCVVTHTVGEGFVGITSALECVTAHNSQIINIATPQERTAP